MPQPQLSPRQTILEANRHLLADGWQPSPEQKPSAEERRWAVVGLESLSACSGTGVGFCRFDYRRKNQRLSVVTVPSQPGRPSVGRVERWWWSRVEWFFARPGFRHPAPALMGVGAQIEALNAQDLHA